MKKTIVGTFIATLLVAPAVALADDEQGRVRDVNSWSVTLENGNLYTVNNSKMLEGIKPGDEVRVTYSDSPPFAPEAQKVQQTKSSQ